MKCWDGNYSGTYNAGGKLLLCVQGWLVIQRRATGQVDFNKTWTEYKQGFGSTSNEFWLGLEAIHRVTKTKPCRIRFNLTDYASKFVQATYNDFRIGPETDNYRLNISGYVTSSTAPDAMFYTNRIVLYPNGHHNGMQFSTYDNDNDIGGANCASSRGGGWWYGQCDWTNLNALWGNMWPYIKWYAGGPVSNKKAFKAVSMEVRCG
uniref:Ficolin-2-like n=1 Tax=Phallusia mammillata TaxID=59560 RepID=A0A6F9DCY4_9ASCI|nr:ficolin-2-like [Phallusia mammillata]